MNLNILNIASLWDDFQRTFYTEPLMFILNVVFVVLVIRHRPKNKKFTVLKIYGIAALSQGIISFCGSLSDYISIGLYEDTFIIDKVTTIAFILIEFYSFYKFFYLQFEGRSIQRIIKMISNILVIIFLSAGLFVIFKSTDTINNFITFISVVISILLLTPSFYYFYVLFTDPPIKNLLKEPSFWITTGIAFLHGLNIPLFLVNGYLRNRHADIWFDIYTINFVAYCFLFMLFIIGILCKNSWRQNLSNQTTSLTS